MRASMAQLGIALGDLRKASGLGLRAAAAHAGISAAYLSLLERGRRGRPTSAVLVALAELYGADVDALAVAADCVPEDVMDYLMSDSRILSVLRDADLRGLTADDLRQALKAWPPVE